MKKLLIITAFIVFRVSGFGQTSQDIIDAMVPTPSSLRQDLIRQTYDSLVFHGLWSKISAIHFFAAHSEQAGLIDWKHPDSTAINNGAGFRVDRGFKGDGSSAYINIKFNPQLEGGSIFTQNDASMGVYSRENYPEASWDLGVQSNDSLSVLKSRRTGDRFYTDINSSSSSLKYLTETDGRGMFTATRINSTTIYGHVNGGAGEARTQASKGLTNLDYYALSLNNQNTPTTYSTNELSMVFFGSYLTNSEVSDLYDIVENYMLEVDAYVDDTYANAKDAGAFGDGINDDWQVLQNLLDSTEIKYIEIGYDTNDVYKISQPLILTRDSVTIEINGILKIKDQTLGSIVQNISEGDTSFVSDNASVYNVGEQISITDTSQFRLYETDRGWGGRIDSINVDTIYMDYASPLDIWVDSLPRTGHTQSCLIFYNVANCTLTGTGIIDNNRANQSDDIHPTYTVNEAENQYVATGFVNWQSDSTVIQNLTLRNGCMHTMSVTSDPVTLDVNYYIKIRNIKLLNGHDKNLLMRFTENTFIDTVYSEGADWEEGIAYYNNNYNAHLDSITILNNGRYGLLWGGGNSDSLVIDKIYSEGNYRYGIALYGNNATISNATIDRMFMYDVYNNCNNHNISNVLIQNQNVSTFPALNMHGGIDNIRINNLTINNCGDGYGIWSHELSGNCPTNVTINRTGVFNHTGTDVKIDCGDVELLNFSWSGQQSRIVTYRGKIMIYNGKIIVFK